MKTWSLNKDYYFASWRDVRRFMRSEDGQKALEHFINPKFKRKTCPWRK